MSLLAFVVLLAVTAGWFLLPLVPALRELWRPSDAEPLTMVGQDAGDLTIFAEGFRGYLRRQLPEAMALGSTPAASELPDGTPVLHLNGRPEILGEVAGADGLISRLVVTNGPVTLPGGETFLLEVYAREDFTGGPSAVYRALLGERDVRLGNGSRVLRWVHAEGNLTVNDSSTLAGRASTVGVMRLGANVRFSRVRAARVVVGSNVPAVPRALPPLLASTMKMPRTARQARGFIRVDGNLEIPPGEALLGTVVVTGSLTIRAGGRISGDVKVHGDCVLETDALIEGSVVCRSDVRLSSGAAVRGPLVSEGEVRMVGGCSVGGPDHAASVAGRTVYCAPGSQVFGAISARVEGRTVADAPTPP